MSMDDGLTQLPAAPVPPSEAPIIIRAYRDEKGDVHLYPPSEAPKGFEEWWEQHTKGLVDPNSGKLHAEHVWNAALATRDNLSPAAELPPLPDMTKESCDEAQGRWWAAHDVAKKECHRKFGAASKAVESAGTTMTWALMQRERQLLAALSQAAELRAGIEGALQELNFNHVAQAHSLLAALRAGKKE